MQNKHVEKSESANTIFYWNGIFDPQGLTEEYGSIIDKLVTGNYQGLDLEKLNGHNVYSVRINHSDRLLFTTIIVKDLPYLMVLDLVLNHDYAKSRFLKPAVLKNYLELNGEALSAELTSNSFKKHQELERLPHSNKPKKPIDFCRIDFYNQKFIQLDELQLKTVTIATLPLIISGAPGSGKSCIALLMLARYIEAHAQEQHPVLYVTESEPLALSMQRAWQSLPVAQNLDANAVGFKSYQQLVHTLAAETKHMTFVDKEDCIKWLGDYVKLFIKNSPLKEQPFTPEFYTQLDKMYQVE